MSVNAFALLDHLFQRPLITVNAAKELLAVSPAANTMVGDLVKMGVLIEVTGGCETACSDSTHTCGSSRTSRLKVFRGIPWKRTCPLTGTNESEPQLSNSYPTGLRWEPTCTVIERRPATPENFPPEKSR